MGSGFQLIVDKSLGGRKSQRTCNMSTMVSCSVLNAKMYYSFLPPLSFHLSGHCLETRCILGIFASWIHEVKVLRMGLFGLPYNLVLIQMFYMYLLFFFQVSKLSLTFKSFLFCQLDKALHSTTHRILLHFHTGSCYRFPTVEDIFLQFLLLLVVFIIILITVIVDDWYSSSSLLLDLS